MSFTKHRKSEKYRGGADLTADNKASFEFKEVLVMPERHLEQFHGAEIEIELKVQGDVRSIRGKGFYEASDPDLGSVLRILVCDLSGDFEFLLLESKWTGSFESSELPGCDYRISLTGCSAD